MSGIYGVVSEKDCLNDLFYGVDYHSHLGTEYGGLVVLGETFQRQIHNIAQTQFKSKFFNEYHTLKGNKGIGAISSEEQPIYLKSKFGEFCVVTNGFIENSSILAEGLFKLGISFAEVSDQGINQTELAAKIISQGSSIKEGIEKLFDMIEGSCSVLVLTRQGIYAARDRLGYTPLVIGQKLGSLAVTSETSAFPNNDFIVTKYVEPGEIVFLSEAQDISVKRTGASTKQTCSFLWIYTGFPASNYEGINTEVVRERCGRCLARRDKDIKPDLVCGVPDSGAAHAIGYAAESGVPYRRPLVKYTPGYGRSYTPPEQTTRDLVAKMKLIPISDIIKGNSIVVCDDSIVRGTQLKNFTVKKLWDSGAREIHVRVACPPLLFPCRFNLSTRSINELAARRAIRAIEGRDLEDISEYLDSRSQKYQEMVSWIKNDLGVTTLAYQTIDDMVSAIGIDRDKLCLYCWTKEASEYKSCGLSSKGECLKK